MSFLSLVFTEGMGKHLITFVNIMQEKPKSMTAESLTTLNMINCELNLNQSLLICLCYKHLPLFKPKPASI